MHLVERYHKVGNRKMIYGLSKCPEESKNTVKKNCRSTSLFFWNMPWQNETKIVSVAAYILEETILFQYGGISRWKGH